MLFLLDANVLIDAHRDYYGMDRVPEFWEWLQDQGQRGSVKIPVEIFEELRQGNDGLARWAKDPEIKADLQLEEEADAMLVTRVIHEGYARDLNDIEIENLGQDPFLIAYALSDPSERCVVTTEVSKPTKQRANRHIPDVCRDFGVRSSNTFAMLRELDFRTGWKRGL